MSCFTTVDPYYLTFDPAAILRVATPADAAAARARLLAYLWPATGSLPSRGVDRVDAGVAPPCPGVAGLLHCDRLTVNLPHGFASYAFAYYPLAPVGKLAVCHHGHEDFTDATGDGDGDYGMRDLVRALVAAGVTVLELFMPGYGYNVGPTTDGHYHGLLAAYDAPGSFAARSLFLEPVAACLNTLLPGGAFSAVGMCGVSGGGWTTTLYAAIDQRVRVSYPVAGSQPLFFNSGPCGYGEDYEQTDCADGGPLYDGRALSYLDLYLMACDGGRKQVQCLNLTDDVAFMGPAHRLYSGLLPTRAAALGGAWACHEYAYPHHYLDASSRNLFLGEFVPMSTAIVIDNGTSGFAESGNWTHWGFGFNATCDQITPTDPPASAVWTFSGLPAGSYRVSVTYPAHANRATNCPYAINGGPPTLVNQQLAPADLGDVGTVWKDIAPPSAPVAITAGGALVVTLTNAGINGMCIADAVRVENVSPPPPPPPPVMRTVVVSGETVTWTQQADGSWKTTSITP